MARQWHWAARPSDHSALGHHRAQAGELVVDKVIKRWAVLRSAVQALLANASAQVLRWLATATLKVCGLHCPGVMPGAPYAPRQLTITTLMPCACSVGTSMPFNLVAEVTASAFIVPLLMYPANSL